MRIFQCMAVFIALAPSAAFAQRPVIAATGPTVSASLGYSYVDLDAAPSTRVGMSGVDSAVSADFLHRLGAALDVGYVRLANVFGSGKHGDVLSYLGGPVFYASRGKRLSPYIRGLAGAARVTGVVPLSGGFATGFVNKFAWDIGAGTELGLTPAFGLRIGVDSLHTAYFAQIQGIRGQWNIKGTVSAVYHFGGQSRR